VTARRTPSLLRRALSTRDGKVGAALIGALVLLSVLGALLSDDPNASDFAADRAADGGPPGTTPAHPLGTDALFRDVLSRLAAGGRVSLLVAGASALVATVLGVSIGVLSAVFARRGARWADGLLMRLVDVLLAFPFLLFVTTLGVLVGRTDVGALILVLGLTGWTSTARIVRARALAVMSQDYVLAARALGATHLDVARSHVLPNVATTAIVLGTSLVGSMILAEAVLGYLAVGLPPPQATWGRMLHEAESLIALRPSLIAAPGVCVALSMIGFHRLGEALRRATASSGDAERPWWIPLDVVLASGALLLLVALPAKELAAPPPAPPADAAPEQGGTLKLATFFAPRTLDPATAPDEMSIGIGRLVFERLLSFDESGNYAPALGTSFSWSEDKKTLSLVLRRGVKFQDGAPLTAADVKRSIERALHPAAASPGAGHFESLVGYAQYRAGEATAIEGIGTEGDDIVTFTLTEPNGTLPAVLSLSFAAPVCPSTPMSVQATTEAELCGAGPFRIASFEAERGVRLVRNTGYYEPGLPYLDAVEVEFNVRPQAQRYRFERGELHLLRELSGADALLVRGDRRWAPYGRFIGSLRVNAIFLNTEHPPFDSAALRRAVSLAVDPAVLSKVRADVEPLSQLVPGAVPGRRPTTRERRHDLGLALSAMREAGYAFDPATGRGGLPDPVEYVTVPDTFEQAAAEVYQQQLARVGIRVRLRLLSHQTYLAEVQKRGRSQMGWAGWQGDYPDPLTFFDPKLVSWSIGPISQNNSFYASAAVDALVAKARQETDPALRDQLFARAEDIVHEDAPWIPVTSLRTFELLQPALRGYRATPLVQLDFTRAWIHDPQRGELAGAAPPSVRTFAALGVERERRP
jgi:ABC-type transport system substrate-binding protein/ABC-type dipeptide/oligopeptide/nickel transport system permease subunit